MTYANARVVEHHAPCGGFYGWRVEYTHADGATTFGQTHWLRGYARSELNAAEGWRATDKQAAARDRLIAAHIADGSEIRTLTTDRSWGDKAVTVTCVARRPDDTKSGFRARIGPRGGVTQYEALAIKDQEA